MKKFEVEDLIRFRFCMNTEILDIGMTIICDDDGKFQIIHWPPLSIEDSVAILQILEVKLIYFNSNV